MQTIYQTHRAVIDQIATISDQVTTDTKSTAPGQEVGDSTPIGPLRMRIANGGGEEFHEADAGAVAGRLASR